MHGHLIALIIDPKFVIMNKPIVLIKIHLIGFIWTLNVISINSVFCSRLIFLRIDGLKEVSTSAREPNMRKFKLLL